MTAHPLSSFFTNAPVDKRSALLPTLACGPMVPTRHPEYFSALAMKNPRPHRHRDSARHSPGLALVTGGTQRIGRAISLALARAGYGVVVHARRESAAARKLVREIAALGAPAHIVFAEFGEADSPTKLMRSVVAEAGPVSLLVNNASTFEADVFGALDTSIWDHAFAVNLRAPVFLAQAFAAQAETGKVRDNASIVNITDQRAFKVVPRQFSYTLTKGALQHATTMLAQALAPHIRVNAVAPGPTLPSPRQDKAEFARQSSALPLRRGPRPDDIAAAVVYLAGATSVTGTTLLVDGGQHVAWETPDVADIEE